MPALEQTTDWAPVASVPAATAASAGAAPDAPSFGDVLDIINPLHHIPLIGGLYRAITGDSIAPAARLLGGSLYGGFIGLAAAAANVTAEETTGQDVGAHMVALFEDDGPEMRYFAQQEVHIATASGESPAPGSFASLPETWYAALERGPMSTVGDVSGGA